MCSPAIHNHGRSGQADELNRGTDESLWLAGSVITVDIIHRILFRSPPSSFTSVLLRLLARALGAKRNPLTHTRQP
jgi:hypothetical protein